jgi:hypothetical protein
MSTTTVIFIKNYPPYNAGDRAGFPDEEVKELMKKGIAMTVEKKAREKPVKNKMVVGRKNKSVLNEPAEPDDDETTDISQYHTGGGWYEVPGAERKMRKNEALKYLEEMKK